MSTLAHDLRLPALVLLGALLAAGCSKSPTKPTDTSVAPQITCPVAPASTVSLDGISAFISYGSPTVVGGKAPVLTNCTPVSGNFFPVGSSTVTCTATDALSRAASCGFSVVVTRSPTIAFTKFVAFGDSITWGENGVDLSAFLAGSSGPYSEQILPHFRLPDVQQYPAQLQQKLAQRYVSQASSIEVRNRGVQGESAALAVGRFSTDITGFQAVLLMEGANDLGNIGAGLNGLKQMVGIAKSRGIGVYLATLPPEEEATAPPRRGKPLETMQMNDGIRVLAFVEGVTLVDVFQAFPPGSLIGQGLLSSDGLHPTGAGYTIIADKFFQVLRATLDTTPP